MDFYSAYGQGFVRVAACTLHTAIGEPATNAESVLEVARECHDEGVGLAVFPELTLSGYSIEDILHAGCAARRSRGRAARHRGGLGRAAAGAGGRRAAALPAPHLQHRRRDPPRTGARRGAEVVPADLPRVLRAPSDGGRRRRARRHPDGPGSRRRRGAVRTRPAVRRRRSARLRPSCRDLRGHVRADTAERGGRARGRDGAGEPFRQPDHDRPGRGPLPAGPLGVVALPGRLRLCRGGRRRVDHRPGVGRPDDDLGERRAVSPVRALPQGRAALGRRRRSRAAALGAAADGHVRRQPGRTTASTRSRSGASSSSSTRPAGTSGCAARWSGSRSCRRIPHGWNRIATRPTTSRSRGWSSGCARWTTRRW